jgi:NTP pyrophosphatase (non-canonical NTP hydrolase)
MNLFGMIEQCSNDSKRWFPKTQDDLGFMTLAMAGEVGEVANLVKKLVRGSITIEEAMEMGLEEEIVDVLIYLCNLMGMPEFNDTDWATIWNNKRAFNEDRFAPVAVDTQFIPDKDGNIGE